MNKLKKSEMFLYLFLIVFAVIWTYVVMPYLENSNSFADLNPVIQYFGFNISMMIVIMITINIPFKLVSKQKVKVSQMLKMGLSSWLVFSFVFDLWQPPYYLSSTGQVLIQDQQALPGTAVDAMMTYLWSNVIPDHVMIFGYSLLYLAVYLFTPVIAVGGIMVMFKPSMVKKALLEA